MRADVNEIKFLHSIQLPPCLFDWCVVALQVISTLDEVGHLVLLKHQNLAECLDICFPQTVFFGADVRFRFSG